MPFYAVNNHQLYYELTGRGPAVALLHHATGSSRSWRRQIPAFTARFQVLAIDRPGFGRSTGVMPWPFDYLRCDADDLLELLDSRHIEQVALVGHSDGAAIALLAAAQRPERITKVVAEAPHLTVEVPRCPDAVREAMVCIEASPDLRAALERDHPERGLQVVQRWADRWLDPAFWSWDGGVAATSFTNIAVADIFCPADFFACSFSLSRVSANSLINTREVNFMWGIF